MAKTPPTYYPVSLTGLTSIAQGNEDYTYRQRPAIDLGITLRNQKLDDFRLNVFATLGRINIFKPAPTKNPGELGPSPLGVPFGVPNNFNREPLLFEKNRTDISIGIYLHGENALESGIAFLTIMFTPSDIEYTNQSGLKSLGILGSDLQRYHYGGSEDGLTFEVDWYGFKANGAESPLDKAEKMLSLTKGAGWVNNTPPIIIIRWGSGEFTPFANHKYIVEKASFKPEQFIQHKFKQDTLLNNSFQPLYVKQLVSLKRVE
jgi:hypothetical protein